MNRFLKYTVFTLAVLAIFIVVLNIFLDQEQQTESNTEATLSSSNINPPKDEGGVQTDTHPLSIELLRNGDYPGSEISIEQTLTSGSNFNRYVASYRSEGLKIYGLLTVPQTEKPENGHPAIIFNHGYIDPDEYRTTQRYEQYQAAFARNGYITFKSDYRGHGNSEGDARGGYGSNDYTIDVLNAISTIKNMEDVDPDRIGMWGHSMGGHITLESMVVRNDIKAGVIWAGVVGSYEDLLISWRPWWLRQGRPEPTREPNERRHWRTRLTEEFGSPDDNPDFWRSISATSYVEDISGPIQLHHASTDDHVPYELSESLEEKLREADKEVELYDYPGDDHNLSSNLSLALQRSVEFFDKYLK